MKRAFSNVAVAVLAAYALALIVSAASAFWSAPGSLGFTADYGATVRALVPGGPAERAGMRVGDAIRLDATPFAQRRYIAGVGAPIAPGTIVDLATVRGSDDRPLRLQAVARPLDVADRWTLFVACAASLIFVVVGTLLIVVRPNPATWGFGLFCLIALPVAADPPIVPDAALALGQTLFYDVVQNAGVAGLVLFALDFPKRFDHPWRLRIRRLLPALFVALALMTLYPDVANLLLGLPAGFENRVLQLTFGAVFALALFILADTYRRIEPAARERVRWVIVGFGVGLVADYIGNTLYFSTLILADPPSWLINVLVSLNVLLPLAVAHAIVRHRVLDIDFVIGRALVFAVLTTLLAAIFSLLDWMLGSLLEDFRLTRVLAAALSICIAFAFSRIEKRTIGAVETVFFRRRRAAEAQLERSIAALPHARTAEVIEWSAVADVAAVLELASAAIFRGGADGPFARTAAAGWRDDECALLDDRDELVLLLRAENRPVDLDGVPWHRPDLPHRDRAPQVAIPMRSRGDLTGFVLYGGHPRGGALDPAERALLERLVTAAGLAFDQLEAQRLRAENERQRATIAELRARLDERGAS